MQHRTVDQSFAQALAYHQAGRLAEAEQLYRQILGIEPQHSDSLHLLGVIALQAGHYDAALQLVQQAVARRPDGAIYHNSLGQALEHLDRRDEAAAAYRAAIRLDPEYPEAYNNLGRLLQAKDQPGEAQDCFDTAIRLQPDFAEAHSNLGNLCKEQGELAEAVACYRRAVALRPDSSAIHSNLLLTLHYLSGVSAADLAHEHRLWADRHVKPLMGERRPHTNDRRPDRRLRVGYVSPDFREHAIARFIRPLLAQHDPEQVEVFAYSDVVHADDVTAHLRGLVPEWRDISALNDAQLAAQVRNDGIDILVDLAAHTARNRLLMFARKPAPVQVTYLAYCSTTGVDAIDYRFTDRFLDPPSQDPVVYQEQSVHLPDCYWCYSAPDLPPQRLPGTQRVGDTPTFGSLNNFAKVTDETLRVWSALLRAAPEADLVLHAREGRHRERVARRLGDQGIAASRLRFVGKQPFEQYLATYQQIDVGLDPLPFTGGTTTCDALWMGVPVVTMTGDTAVSRGGLTLLSNAGLGHLAAGPGREGEARYVQIATDLLRDADQRATLRRTLRRQLQSSSVMDAARFARNVESAYRSIWQRWCARN
jgi:protein O-GlcNAc transferase